MLAEQSKSRYGVLVLFTAILLTKSSTEPTSSVSCLGRCGDVIDVSCSCDVTCLVYSNCCEDFRVTCPETVMAAMNKFPGAIGSASATCSSNNVMVISGCPKNASRTGSLREFWEDNRDLVSDDNTSASCWATALEYDDFVANQGEIRNDEDRLASGDTPDVDIDDGAVDQKRVRRRVFSELSSLHVTDRIFLFVTTNLSRLCGDR